LFSQITIKGTTKSKSETLYFSHISFTNDKGNIFTTLSDTDGNYLIQLEKGKYQINCAHPDTIGTPYPDVTAPVNSYNKSLFGLYNMLGNVAEMVQEKGIGGSWRNNLEECRVGKNQEYTKPTAWLGFRCVCVIH
jgi:hypothetical protein